MMTLVHTLAVAEYLNFRPAANALGVAQSSVSARVKALEEDLGILLFERHARGVRLTEAGHHFVERIAAGVDQLDHAVKTAGMAAAGESGRLRIGIHAADRLDVVFVAGTPELPDCHSRRIWTEPLLAVLPERHPLAGQSAVTWADLAGETFLVRHGGTGPQVHSHIVLRHAGRWPAPSILRFDVGRGALLSMVGQGFGITIVGVATALLPTSGIFFLPFADEPEPITFSAIWSPSNRSAALRNLLTLANDMGRIARPD